MQIPEGMTNISLKIFRLASLAIVLIVLMLDYVQLPDSIAVTHNSSGRPIGFMDKQNFFYIATAVIVGLTVVFGLLKSALLSADFKKLNPASKWANNPEELKGLFLVWSDVSLILINVYLIFTLLGLKSVNLNTNQTLDRDYNWFIILGAVLLIVIIFYLPIRLLFTDPKEK